MMKLLRRETQLRQTLLKALYDENLRVIGKKPATKASRFPFLKGRLLFLYVMLLLFSFGYTDYLNPLVSSNDAVINATIQHRNYAGDYPDEIFPSDYSSLLNETAVPLKRVFGLEVKTIIIDAGHGGDDPGAIGTLGTMEKNITLDIAQRLKERLEEHMRYNVLMTREKDKSLSLKRRIEIANSSKADIFISIHVNYLPAKPIDIIETYYFGPSSDENTLRLAAKENEGSRYSLSDYNEVIQKIGNTLKLQESRVLAAQIQKNLFLHMKTLNKNVLDFGVKRAPFLVLLGVDMPGILVEVACLSNKEEEYKLNNPNYREDIARYLEAGIIQYLLNGRSNS